MSEVHVASLDAFAATDAIAVDVGERQIAIYLVDGAAFATDNRCTHGEARLCDGFLEGHEIDARTTRVASTSAAARRPARRPSAPCRSTRCDSTAIACS